MKIDSVFSGGGVKAYAFAGALKSMKEHGIQLERVAGTSAGAIVASFLAADYTIDELEEMLCELDLQQFLDPPVLSKFIPFSKWFFLYFKMGIYKGDKLEDWLYDQLAAKGVYTFSDLKPGYLKVVISDLTLGKMVVLPDDLERIYGIDPASFPVSAAIRMSAGFPYFFMPKKLQSGKQQPSLIVDGGLLSNFPMWIFDNGAAKKKRPLLGVTLSENIKNYQPRKIKNAIEMFYALFSTMKQAHDSRYISTSDKENIIFIPVQHVDTTDFMISDAEKEELMETGEKSTDLFLQKWPT